MKNKSSFDNELRLRILTRHQALTLVLLSLGTTQPTLMTPRLVMATSLMILQRKKPSSITVVTSAARLTSQMIKPTSRNMMPTYHTVSCWLTSTAVVKSYHISSMVNSSMMRLACTTMAQDT